MFERLMSSAAMTCRVVPPTKIFREVARFIPRSGLIALAVLSVCALSAQQSDRKRVNDNQPAWKHTAAQDVSIDPVPQRSVARGTTPSFTPSTLSFLQAAGYYTGDCNPGSIAVADLNGDHKIDIVVFDNGPCCGNPNTHLSVLLGNGDGTFQPPAMYAAQGGGSVAIADVNGDGKADIVFSAGFLTVYLGNGDGTFQSPTITPWNNGGNTIAVGDLNGDGKPDAAVYVDAGAVSVQLGNGDGTFQYPPVVYQLNVSGQGAVAIDDLNGDGKPDLIAVTWGGQVFVLLGNGDGTFQAPVGYASGGSGTIAVATADVNHDGKADVITASCGVAGCSPGSYGSVGILLGNGDGTLQSAISYSVVSSPNAVAVADANSDGKLDIVVGNWGPPSGFSNDGAVSVLLGNGDGTFQPYIPFLSGGNEVEAIAVGDLNGDGRPDVITSNFGSIGSVTPPGTVSVLLNVTGVTQIPTTTTLVSSSNPSGYGKPVTFTTTVNAGSGGFSGEVQFLDGPNQIGYGVLTNGQTSTSISVSSLSASSHAITAQYLGGLGFRPSTSAVLTQNVIASTSTSVISERNPAAPGSKVLFSANVTSAAGSPPNGEIVTFYAGSSVLGTAPLNQGYANLTTTFSTQGFYIITAVYFGDSHFTGSTSPGLTQVVRSGKLATTTALASSLNPSFYGQTVMFSATVSSIYGAIPDGETVTFYDGSTVLGTGTTAGGVATFTTSSLKGATHTIKATYMGDANFGMSSATMMQVVNLYSTTTTMVSSLNPSSYGQTVIWTATVTSSGPYIPTGKVKFVGLGTATLSGGIAVLSKTWLNSGTYPTTAEYLGDSASAPSNSANLGQVVYPASTSTALTSSSNPSLQGQTVTFTAKVTSSTGAHPTGTVTFTAGSSVLGTVTLSGLIATVSTSTLPVGTTVIQATYNGVTDFTGSSASLTQTVTP